MINSSNTNGKLNGIYKEYYENGNIKINCSNTNGLPNGIFNSYHENGKLHLIKNFSNGLLNGISKEYYENGNIKVEALFANDKNHGSFKQYYENGKLKFTTNYSNGLLNGISRQYYENGNIHIESTYANDKEHGTHKQYYENGKLEFTTKYSNGLENGIRTQYDTNGYINDLITYENDKINGLFLTLRNDTIHLSNFKDDVANGFCKIYKNVNHTWKGDLPNIDTNLLSLVVQGQYYNGEAHGEWKYYFPKTVKKKTGIKETDTARLFLIANYSNGKLNGYYELRDSFGKLIFQGNYKDGLKEGKWLVYTILSNDTQHYTILHYALDNAVRNYLEVGNYLNDERDGMWLWFNRLGRKTKTLNYKNGKYNGEIISWSSDKDGVPITKSLFENGKIKKLTTYDSLGNPLKSYDIYDEGDNNFYCRIDEFFRGGDTYRSTNYFCYKNSNTLINTESLDNYNNKLYRLFQWW